MIRNLLALATVAVFAFGCGGEDAGSGGGSNVGIFVTDAPGNYSHVWVSIKEVDLIGATGTVPVFQSSAGQSIDLASLNVGGQQQFQMLAPATLPSGHFSRLNVIMDSNVVVFSGSSATGTSLQCTGSQNGQAEVGFPLTMDTPSNIVIDFNIPKWTFTGTSVTPVVQPGDPSKISSGNQPPCGLAGMIASISGTAPNQTITMTFGLMTLALNVQTNASTVISNADGSADPTLSTGEFIRVNGTFNVAAGAFVASAILIGTPNTIGNIEGASGTVASIGTNTFNMTVGGCLGFVPASTTITVDTGSTTTFIGPGGLTLSSAQFYSGLATTSRVDVQGTFNATTSTLAAARVLLDSGSPLVLLFGVVSNLNSSAGTFTLTVNGWPAPQIANGAVYTVDFNAQTKYAGGIGLSNGVTVAASGSLSGTVLTAANIAIDPPTASPGRNLSTTATSTPSNPLGGPSASTQKPVAGKG